MLEILISLMALSISAGFIGAISGLGGGVFIVPALVVLAHMPMKVAVGASLISVVATSAGASVAFVRDGWTNLKVAMVLECATVTGAVIGAYLAGVVPTVVLELLFAAMMLQSAYFTITKRGDDILTKGDPLAERLGLAGEVPDPSGKPIHYEVVKVPQGGALMVVAGLMSGLLGIGSGALKVMAMDYIMHLPLKVSSATSNFMIGVTAGAGALVFLSRGDVATTIAAPVAIGVTAGALAGSRVLPHLKVESSQDRFRDNSSADRGRDGMARVVGDLSDAETGRRSNTQGMDADSASVDFDRLDDHPHRRTHPDLHHRARLLCAALRRSAAGSSDRQGKVGHCCFERIREGNPHAVLTIGLFELTLVPLARVAFCFILFIKERDYTYVAFTAYVLAGLIVGVLVGSVG